MLWLTLTLSLVLVFVIRLCYCHSLEELVRSGEGGTSCGTPQVFINQWMECVECFDVDADADANDAPQLLDRTRLLGATDLSDFFINAYCNILYT